MIKTAPVSNINYFRTKNRNYLFKIIQLNRNLDTVYPYKFAFAFELYGVLCSLIEPTSNVLQLHDQLMNLSGFRHTHTEYVCNWIFPSINDTCDLIVVISTKRRHSIFLWCIKMHHLITIFHSVRQIVEVGFNVGTYGNNFINILCEFNHPDSCF